MYHLRPPTRVRNFELIKHWEPKKVTDSPLRHHHLKTASIPRRGDLYTGRVPMLFNQDVIAYRARPAKAYDKFQYYKNGGADEIIFVFHGSGVIESVFGKLPYRAEDYIVIPRGITYRMVPDKIDEEDYLILESVGPVRIPQRYLNHEGQIKMGAPYSERDLHGPSEIITIELFTISVRRLKKNAELAQARSQHQQDRRPDQATQSVRAWAPFLSPSPE
jgi:homogentisate 1,2-dioxygenase